MKRKHSAGQPVTVRHWLRLNSSEGDAFYFFSSSFIYLFFKGLIRDACQSRETRLADAVVHLSVFIPPPSRFARGTKNVKWDTREERKLRGWLGSTALHLYELRGSLRSLTAAITCKWYSMCLGECEGGRCAWGAQWTCEQTVQGEKKKKKKRTASTASL